MLNTATLYYFSPTGGTKKIGSGFCEGIAKTVKEVDLGKRDPALEQPAGDIVAAAAPVFGGRLPALVAEKLRMLDGSGKRAVSMVVYGNRAYEDALLELNHVLTESGFEVIASGAFIAQHSMAPEVAQGRPDNQDMMELRGFAERVLDKLSSDSHGTVRVPGNFPYKEGMRLPAAPVTLTACDLCGTCGAACPTGAIHIGENKTVVTTTDRCILCMACVSVCPQKARVLPTPLKERMEQMLGPLKSVRRENETYL